MSPIPLPDSDLEPTELRVGGIMHLRTAYAQRGGKARSYRHLHELFENYPETFKEWADSRDDITLEVH